VASKAEIARLQTALDAKPSSPELLLENPDADVRMLDGVGGYGAPEADARMLGGGGGYGGSGGYGGGAWDVDSSRAASQQGMFAPPPIRPPGTFGITDADSATKGISTQWQRYIDNNPTKVKTEFGPGENTKLARLQKLGRCIQDALQGTETLLNNLDPDNVAVDVLAEIEDEVRKASRTSGQVLTITSSSENIPKDTKQSRLTTDILSWRSKPARPACSRPILTSSIRSPSPTSRASKRTSSKAGRAT